jgi:serine protease Do
MLAVEKADGTIEGGSAFGITKDGLLVTNRHVILDKSGAKPRKVGVIFNDTRDWLPATVVKWSDGSDLALIKVEREGPFPVVAGVSRSAKNVRVGSPVAIIGYPLSLDTPMEGEGMNVKAASTLGPGTISKLLDDVVQVDAFAGSGSSGSPLFDSRGNVIGIIWGGNPESGGRIVYAVPSEKLIAFLPPEAQGIVR